jgi:sec-independent protein translocase protein TatC
MSGALDVDDDTKRAIANGRAALGDILSTAQRKLQIVFIVFVLGLFATVWILRAFVWSRLKRDLFAQMGPEIAQQTRVIAVTPFDVILLQVKIGLVVGVLLAIPLLLYYSRDSLRQRGWWPGNEVPRWKVVSFTLTILGLFSLGVTYAYSFFFPIMFNFLATNAINSGFEPAYSIVKWAQFIFILSMSFGIAAQLPLVMSTLSYTEIIPYETFRDKWKHAVIILYAGGAIFTPPDPITQLMWATPLVVLYAISLRITKTVVIAKRSGEAVDIRGVARERWNVLAGTGFVSFVAVYGFFTRGGLGYLNAAVRWLPDQYRPTATPSLESLTSVGMETASALTGGLGPVSSGVRETELVYYVDPFPRLGPALGLPQEIAAAIVATLVTLVVVGVVFFRFVARALERDEIAAASIGDPADIDVTELDETGVRAAPIEVFEAMDEDEATRYAGQALEADNPEKAQAIFARFDEAESLNQGQGGEEGKAGQADVQSGDPPAEEGSGVVTETTAGIVNSFTEDETTEEDIGGYYYDIAFVLESLTSKAFRIVGLFMTVLAGVFIFLYRGGIKIIKDNFVSKMPQSMADQVDIVSLHPVEHLIFEIKFSTLVALVVTVPLILYYAWPALKSRGWVRGDRRTFVVWGGSLLVGMTVGGFLGYAYVAPGVISYLAQDAMDANMVIAYRIHNFGWLVVYTTIGVGLLAEIPVSMLLFHYGGIVTFQSMRDRWREFVVATFAITGYLSPRGVFTMLILAIPISLAYLLGLALLWLTTGGGRFGPNRDFERARERLP